MILKVEPATGDGSVTVRFAVIAGTTITRPLCAAFVRETSASFSSTGAPPRVDTSVIVPVVVFLLIVLKVLSDRTGPENVVLAMRISCRGKCQNVQMHFSVRIKKRGPKPPLY